ncbi:MAG TPA: thymidine phosphorylase, partial [Polyangiaceae bacterium]|nr:thymidine phosphorylase [Polyangiaceae bacterium]
MHPPQASPASPAPPASLVDLIAHKRDGGRHAPGDLRRLVAAFVAGELADYQMSAWLMAAFLRGLSDEEAVELTDAMLRSGEVLDLGDVPGFKVDKHSTGGVGDKVSICLAPLVAACGVPVPMVSGRGLGHTGGTLDKLEAIPGFRVDLDKEAFRRTVREVGSALIGQTPEIAPADRRMYALRDVTGTVESLPLIVASILSKKLAEGIDALVLDVKVGRGAFMKTEPEARALAEALVRVCTRGGKPAVALLTDMDTPLGRTIGNALETREALEVLRGGGPPDLVACTFALGAEMLLLAGRAPNTEQAHAVLRAARDSGRGAEVMRRLVQAQGGDPAVVDDPRRVLPAAPVVRDVLAPAAGFVADVDPMRLAKAAVALGAGRTRAEQRVRPDVGFELEAVRGDKVEAGAPIVRVHAASDA